MTSLYWVQVVTAAALAANVVCWGWVSVRQAGILRVIALPPLSWCLHGFLFFAVLFALRAASGGTLPADQAVFFNWWSTAVRLHGALACLSLLYFIHDWQQVTTHGRG